MIITISSQKGGTGKTSTSTSLAARLARKGQRTLLVDIDSQANSSKVLLPDYLRIPKDQTIYTTILQRKPLPLHPTGIAHLAVVPPTSCCPTPTWSSPPPSTTERSGSNARWPRSPPATTT